MYLLLGWQIATMIMIIASWVTIGNFGNREKRRLQIGLGLTAVTLVLVPLWYEFSGPFTIPVALLANGTAELRPNGMICWESGQSYSAVPRNDTAVYGEVRVITDNPKVREIHYNLQTRIIDLNVWFSRPQRRELKRVNTSGGSMIGTGWYGVTRQPTTVDEEIGKTVITLLFEFNEAHSRDLARFYNPLDPQQSENLKQLLEPWLNERLAADGIRVSYDSFSIQ